MSGRPRAARAGTGRDNKEGDVETELLNRVIDAVRRAKEHNDNCRRLGEEIVALEEEIKAKGSEYFDCDSLQTSISLAHQFLSSKRIEEQLFPSKMNANKIQGRLLNSIDGWMIYIDLR